MAWMYGPGFHMYSVNMRPGEKIEEKREPLGTPPWKESWDTEGVGYGEFPVHPSTMSFFLEQSPQSFLGSALRCGTFLATHVSGG